MPLYEYQCEACGVRFERRQHIDEEAVKVCPECGGKVHRLIHPVGIIFKGSGFYVTDNRAKSSTAIPGNAKKHSEKPQESTSTDKSSKSSKSNKSGESSKSDTKSD
jgi:putative FmdB family regulatory protein